MFLKQLITLLLFCSLYTGFSQTDPKVITSPIYEHKNPRIYVQEMLGEENGIYYVLYSTQPVKTSTLPSLYIGMYANEDMHLIRSQKLIPDNPDDQKRYKNFLLEKYLLTKNGLIFFFENKIDKVTRDVYLGTFDLNLNSKKDFEK